MFKNIVKKMEHNIGSIKMLNNSAILYGLLMIAMVNMYSYVMTNRQLYVVFMLIIGFLTSFFSALSMYLNFEFNLMYKHFFFLHYTYVFQNRAMKDLLIFPPNNESYTKENCRIGKKINLFSIVLSLCF